MLTVELDHKSKIPLYEQLYIKIREMVLNGELKEGERLPAERGLAMNLQISRNTVALAYEQLCAEGYVEVRPQSGCYVNKVDNTGIKGRFNLPEHNEREVFLEKE